MPRYATLVAALTTWTGTLTARPSGSVMAPEIVPTGDGCAVRFAATRTKKGSHLMYGLYKSGSLEDQVLRLGLAGRLRLCPSAETLAEYAPVLPRPKFRLQPGEVKQALARLLEAS